MPPILRIDLGSPVPAYRQVADGLRAMLVEGRLREGDVLPTVRELALELGVHHNTVAEGYRLLAEEGWLELARRRGARVLARPAPAADKEAWRAVLSRLRAVAAEARAAGVPTSVIFSELESIIGGGKMPPEG
ncbi:MAG: GntR family transcriptional regulator [Archangium sp.]